jgi:hypothetical protein
VEEEENKNNEPYTKLVGKNYSPLIIRRYSLPILHFVAIISDDDLTDLDKVVRKFWKKNKLVNDIQGLRNLAGSLSDFLIKFYEKVEGVAVVFVADKMVISSLAGDFMNHEQCRIELYSLLNLMANV